MMLLGNVSNLCLGSRFMCWVGVIITQGLTPPLYYKVFAKISRNIKQVSQAFY